MKQYRALKEWVAAKTRVAVDKVMGRERADAVGEVLTSGLTRIAELAPYVFWSGAAVIMLGDYISVVTSGMAANNSDADRAEDTVAQYMNIAELSILIVALAQLKLFSQQQGRQLSVGGDLAVDAGMLACIGFIAHSGVEFGNSDELQRLLTAGEAIAAYGLSAAIRSYHVERELRQGLEAKEIGRIRRLLLVMEDATLGVIGLGLAETVIGAFMRLIEDSLIQNRNGPWEAITYRVEMGAIVSSTATLVQIALYARRQGAELSSAGRGFLIANLLLSASVIVYPGIRPGDHRQTGTLALATALGSASAVEISRREIKRGEIRQVIGGGRRRSRIIFTFTFD